jgi:hypothetical protein
MISISNNEPLKIPIEDLIWDAAYKINKIVGLPDNLIYSSDILINAYPNPFYDRIIFKLNLPEEESATLRIFNSGGLMIRMFFVESNLNEITLVVWDGKDKSGKESSPGVYYGVLEYDSKNYTSKVIKF